MSETHYHRMRDLPSTHLLGSGTSMCAGCGGLQAIKQAYDVLGSKTVFVNAAGCMTLLSCYPFTPFRGSWLYTSMASAPAGAQGIRDALDILRDKRRLPPDDDLQVVVLTGDGSANGMGLAATSAAIERGLDFIYLCYDNEGYANTGQQTSAATPHGARTTTDLGSRGVMRRKKDLFAIWAAHKPTYVATVSPAEPLDLARKLETARTLKGPRLIIAYAACPTGWGYEPNLSVEIAKLAVRSGIWPLKEYRNGSVTHSKPLRSRIPVEGYLRLQGRYAHLFEPQINNQVIKEIQDEIDAYWAAAT